MILAPMRPAFTNPARRRLALVVSALAAATVALFSIPVAAEEPVPLFVPLDETRTSEGSREIESLAGSLPEGVTRSRSVAVDASSLDAMIRGRAALEIELFDGERILVEPRATRRLASGSRSWAGRVRGAGPAQSGPVVLVTRDGVTVGSIRVGGAMYLLLPGRLHEIDEASPRFREREPSIVTLPPERLAAAERLAAQKAAGLVAEDDGSIHDLLVVYTPRARDDAGGLVAIENLIDLGVVETNQSYETSGIDHRVQLVHTAITDYDEFSSLGDPRDLIQDPDDGVMDEVHGLRDLYGADLVLLVLSGNGCGRAYIMNEVSLAFEAFAFAWTDYFCISPGYTFQHELGHIQSGRHQRTAEQPDSPFPYNFGFTDPTNQFRTIMAAGSAECPSGCPRRLAWSNPDVLDAETGEPMGIPETEPLPADNRKALNATGWTVANFRLSRSLLFADAFESGDFVAWELVER